MKSKNNKALKIIALSQISMMLLEVFAFAFIMAFVFSGVGIVSALTPWEVNGNTYYLSDKKIDGSFDVYRDSTGKSKLTTASGDTQITSSINAALSGSSAPAPLTPVQSNSPVNTVTRVTLNPGVSQAAVSPPVAIGAAGNAPLQRTTFGDGAILQYNPKTGDYSLTKTDGKIINSKFTPSQYESYMISRGTKDGKNYVQMPADPDKLPTVVTLNTGAGTTIYNLDNKDYTFIPTDPSQPVVSKTATPAEFEAAAKTQGILHPEQILDEAKKSTAQQTPPKVDPAKPVDPAKKTSSMGNFSFTYLIDGLKYAGIVLGLAVAVGGAIGGEKGEQIKTLGVALAAGIMAGSTVQTLIDLSPVAAKEKFGEATWRTGYLGKTGLSVGVGLVVAYLIAANNIKSTKTKEITVNFKCLQWQAPNGGESCTKCNDDKQMPCSEYRCKSLGQTCKLLNAGSSKAQCIDGSRDDVTSPGIKPDNKILTSGLSYSDVTERPPGGNGPAGMTITGTAKDGCIEAFTPFEFGIITTDTTGDQPAQCKVDYNHTNSFDEMNYYMSNDNLYVIEHKQVMMLPGTDLLNTAYAESNGTLQIKNDGNYNLYIRCQDGNGNKNKDEFNVRFCIDKTPDTQAPQIKSTSINSGSGVKYQADNVSIQVYTNEPSNCRWSKKDASYTNLEYNMTCSNKVWEVNAEMLYTCTTTLTGIKDREDNNFYFRCKDLKENTMQQSYPLVLKGSQPLTLLKVGPTGIVGGATSTITATLEASTDNGLDNGKATCYYSTTQNTIGIEFVNTKSTTHTQPLDLTNGPYTYYITCIDGAGNSASNSTKFTIYVDKDAPMVLRAYTYESKLTIVTNEDSTCRYSNTDCNFDLAKLEGTAMPYDETKNHYSEFGASKTYYIKCKDKHDNQPSSAQCSFIVRPFSLTVA